MLKHAMSGLVLLALALGHPSGASGLDVGDRAPDFSLPSTMGGEIKLSQYRGTRLVLIEFYGEDFSPV